MDFVGSSLKRFEYYFLLGLKYNFSVLIQRTRIFLVVDKIFDIKALRPLDLKEIVSSGLELYITKRSHAETSALKFWKCIFYFSYIIGTAL
jgi:hypothetical protein